MIKFVYLHKKGDITIVNFYQRIRDMREDHDLTQKQVAAILDIGQSDYSQYELGKHMMGIDKYIILAKYYNVSLDFLTGLIDTPKPLYSDARSSSKTVKITNKGDNNKFNIKQ